jgi:tRNA(Ile)-lysidine synthase
MEILSFLFQGNVVATPWLEQVERAVTRWLGSGLGSAWVVAVSGGSDSVGLLRALHAMGSKLGLRLSVAHLDHGVRGESARADAAFVAGLAKALELPFDLGHWQPTRAGHFEADARRARYEWLAEVARARGAAAVAVGHTRDDQAETILHRIVRGTGLRGLAGMPARRPLDESGSVKLVRPLLKVSRQEIRFQLAAIGQPYRDDASNADTARTRARIRHDLLPRLATEYNPAVAEALVRLGELAAASSRSVQRRVLEIERVATLSADHDTVTLMRQELLQFPRFLRAEVLRLAWRRAGWPEAGMGAERWRRLADLARRTRARTSVGGGIELTTDHALLILRRQAAPPVPARWPIPAESLPLDVPGSVPWVGGRVVVTLDPDAPRDESIDLDRLIPPLWVRSAVSGDRFEPLGMDGRSTLLNDFFRGRRVARAERPRVALVCDQSGIVWVVGHRIAHRVRRTADTRQTLGLRWEPP